MLNGLKDKSWLFRRAEKLKIYKQQSFFIFKQLIWLKHGFFKWKLMLPFNLFHMEQAVFKVPLLSKPSLYHQKYKKMANFNHEYLANY
jgi:hypothetical protein